MAETRAELDRVVEPLLDPVRQELAGSSRFGLLRRAYRILASDAMGRTFGVQSLRETASNYAYLKAIGEQVGDRPLSEIARRVEEQLEAMRDQK